MVEYYSVIHRLPAFLSGALAQLSPVMAGQVHEIRLRSERPVVFSTPSGQVLAQNLIPKAADLLKLISHKCLQECFYSLCNKSVHSYEQQLAHGFFTLPGGHRVGVAGVFNYAGQQLRGFQAITSLNIRIARAVFLPIEDKLLQYLRTNFHGMIIVGPPGSGKTTLLRSMIQALSNSGKKVTVIDERFELWPCDVNGFCREIPLNCDVLSGCDKANGIIAALRSLGPQVIACDELGGLDELKSLEQGRQAGVEFLCSVHADNLDDLMSRLNRSKLELSQDFLCCVFLSSSGQAGKIREIIWL